VTDGWRDTNLANWESRVRVGHCRLAGDDHLQPWHRPDRHGAARCQVDLTAFDEHREVPDNPLGELIIESQDFDGEFILAEGRDRMPLTYMRQVSTPE
jgi:hypothetical protein